MMKITGSTRITGIFGDPVEHSLSPAMQNAAFESAGLNIAYLPFHVGSSQLRVLKNAVAGIRALNILGVNVTIPHKQKVIKYLDVVDPNAGSIGAVNTIVNRDGRLHGYNTDGSGYLLSLRDELDFTPEGKNIVLLGAGGAARGIFFSLLHGKPKSVIIANRTLKKAERLAVEFEAHAAQTVVKAIKLKKNLVKPHAPEADLVINTTSLGLMGRGSIDLPLEDLPATAIVSDIVYRPLETGLIKDARSMGLRTHTGLGMLARQGALSFELWTGLASPVDAMKSAALEELQREAGSHG